MSCPLKAMGEQFAGVIDVTIAYRQTKKSLLGSFTSGEQDQLSVHMDVLPIPPELMHGDYEHDAEFRARFQAWLNTLWARKEERIARPTKDRPAQPAPRLAHGW